MLENVKSKNINVIVAFKLDRLTRSVYDIKNNKNNTYKR